MVELLTIVAAVVGVASSALGVAAFVASSPPASSPKPHRPQHAARRNPYAAPRLEADRGIPC